MKYGYRTATMAGCIIAAIGLVLSSFATSVYWLLGSYSILCGEYKPLLLNVTYNYCIVIKEQFCKTILNGLDRYL